MKEIERRVSDALADLEARLAQGIEVEAALRTCSEDHELRKDVIEHRARQNLGDLSSFRDRTLRSAKLAAREHRAARARELYLIERPENSFRLWFESFVGRPPSQAELEGLDEDLMLFEVRRLMREATEQVPNRTADR